MVGPIWGQALRAKTSHPPLLFGFPKKNPADVATEPVTDAAPSPGRPQTPATPAPANATSDGLTS